MSLSPTEMNLPNNQHPLNKHKTRNQTPMNSSIKNFQSFNNKKVWTEYQFIKLIFSVLLYCFLYLFCLTMFIPSSNALTFTQLISVIAFRTKWI